MRTRGTGKSRRAAIVVGLFASFAILAGFNCPDGAPEPMLELYHASQSNPWKQSYNFNNIHSSQLCSGIPTSCYDNQSGYCQGTLPGETVDINTMQSLDSFTGVDDWEWRRDRIMFFENCGPECRGYPDIESGQGTYRTAGYYRYREGTGASLGIDPLPVGRSVGHIRRYRRGACSKEIDLSEIGIANLMARKIRDGFECWGGVWSTETWEADTTLYLGSDDCTNETGENKDYIHIHIKIFVNPAHYLANAYFTYTADYWLQLGAKKRSYRLNCPEPGECPGGCSSCNKECSTLSCTVDSDCCDIPGAVCDGNNVYGVECNASGECEKESFLDVINWKFSDSWYRTNACKWDSWCSPTYWILEGILSGINPLKDIYYPMIQAIYDMMWTPAPTDLGLFSCTADNDVVCHSFKHLNVQGRCNNDLQVCEFRPMYVRGMNIYPTSAEIVLARSNNDPEYTFFSLDGGNPDLPFPDNLGVCEEIPWDTNWSLMRNEWLQ